MRTAQVIPVSTTALSFAAHAQDYAAWKTVNKDGSWTRAAEKAVSSTELHSATPKDIALFCPAYETADASQRQKFWVGLLSAMARPESNFKPETKYVEPNITDAAGVNVTSRGLLQISKESANQKVYRCGIQQAEDLHDPEVNITCAAKIMNYWVQKEKIIAAQSPPTVGGARYWSVLRAWRKHIPEISGFTKTLDVCRKAS